MIRRDTSTAAWALVILYVLFAGFYGLGSYALIEPDEPRYAQASLEMIEGESPLVPLLGGRARINKPPLFYWSIMASYGVFGVNEFAARLPSALAGLLTAVVTCLLARDIYGRSAALFSVPLLYSMPLFFAASHLAITDMMLTAFVTTALYLWWRSRREGGAVGLVVAAWAALGLAFLAKGPVSAALFLLTVLAFSAAAGTLRNAKRLFHWAGPAVFLAIALPWPVAVTRLVPGAWDLWWRETIGRYAVGVDHDAHILFPLVAVLGGSLPWFALALPARWGGAGKLWEGLKREPGRMFLAVWVAVVIVFFGLSKSQIFTYVLPAMPPIAVGAAGMLARCTGGGRDAPRAPLVRASIAALVLAGGALVYGSTEGVLPAATAIVAAIGALGGTIVFGVLVRAGRLKSAAGLIVFLVCCGTLLGGGLALNRLGERRSFRPVAACVGGMMEEAEEVLFCGPVRHSLSFYSGRLDCRGALPDEIARSLAGGKRVMVVIKKKHAEAYEDTFRVVSRFGAGVLSGDEYVCLMNFAPDAPE